MDPSRIRNFSIIAHIDHGKSTLADRLLELTGAVTGVRWKARSSTTWTWSATRDYDQSSCRPSRLQSARRKRIHLELIDTPGHVDFSYEVSRSLSACEGALLIVDASQGVEAQTLANTYLAIENNLELIPVINKIDLPGAEPEKAIEQIEHFIGLETHNAILTSAKTGQGVEDVLEAIVREVPMPKGDPDAPLKALIFDSWYDSYRGVIVLFRVIDGSIRTGMKIRFFNTGRDYQVEALGVNRPRPTPIDQLGVGEVGFLTASIKAVADVQIGDTITEASRPTKEPFPGFPRDQTDGVCGTLSG
jgi:GTP-binding protein LepA